VNDEILDYTTHIFKSPQYRSVVLDAVSFFENTPVLEFPVSESFSGTGVYGLYYRGDHRLYGSFLALNTPCCKIPIYIGKAVPPGWRTARTNLSIKESNSLSGRLREHQRSISACEDLNLKHFRYRFVILNDEETDLISALESTLIRKYKPLWNNVIDGFGNHDPGMGRTNQAKSEWDVLHRGRPWAEKLTGEPPDLKNIEKKIAEYFSS
jgi:hypothetical protein